MEIVKYQNANLMLYCVQKDDLFASILTRFNIEPQNIVRNDSSLDLYEGEIIKIISKHIHIVKPMENLQIIAQKYGINEEKIIAQNFLTNKRLFVGQILNIDQ